MVARIGTRSNISDINKAIIEASETDTFPHSSVKKAVSPIGIGEIKDSMSSCSSQSIFSMFSRLVDQSEKNQRSELENINTVAEAQMSKLKDLYQSSVKFLKDNTEELQTHHKWSYLNNIAQYFGYTMTSLAGIAAFSNPAGAVAAVAGTAGLVSRVLTDIKTWEKAASYFTEDKKLQKSISSKIDIISSSAILAGTGAGIYYYGTAAIASGAAAIARSSESLKLLMQGSTILSTSLSATTSYKANMSKSKLKELESIQILSDSDIKTNKLKIERSFSDIEENQTESTNIFTKFYSMIKKMMAVNKTITQGE